MLKHIDIKKSMPIISRFKHNPKFTSTGNYKLVSDSLDTSLLGGKSLSSVCMFVLGSSVTSNREVFSDDIHILLSMVDPSHKRGELTDLSSLKKSLKVSEDKETLKSLFTSQIIDDINQVANQYSEFEKELQL